MTGLRTVLQLMSIVKLYPLYNMFSFTHSLKIIFAGTPEFAVPSLRTLIDSPHEIISVYTQPDRPSGRGQKLTASPIKQLALNHHIPVHQPTSLRDAVQREILKNLAPDLIVVVAYGLILPKEVLEIPQFGCINVHASLLPQWRGAAPIQRAILAGDKTTGVTIMQMDEGLDTGAMLAKENCNILSTDTSENLHDRLSEMGATLLLKTIENFQFHNIKTEIQNSTLATYAKKIEKHEAEINWKCSADEIDRAVRAFNPWPVAFTSLNGNVLRIWQAEKLNEITHETPGKILRTTKEGIDIATGEGILRLLKIQLPGGRVLHVSEILNAKADLFGVGNVLNAS